MLDRILPSAAPDGMLYNEVNAETLAPIDSRLSDNWGYVYGVRCPRLPSNVSYRLHTIPRAEGAQRVAALRRTGATRS